jgi:hypothetical protein
MDGESMVDERWRRRAIVAVGALFVAALAASLLFALVPAVSDSTAGRLIAGLSGAAAMLLGGLLVALLRAGRG